MDHPRIWWKELLKSRLAKRYSAIAATGRRAGEYIQKLGVPKTRIFEIGNVVDNAHFENVHRITLKNQSEERRRRNLPVNYFITVARYSPEKNYPMLLEAFKKYREQGGEWELVIVGAGPLQKDIFELVQIHRIPGVHFVEWQQYEELPVYYSLASCFILASINEPWGLVVNEAMVCGLPILISQHCGCLPELCQPSINGYDFAPDDAEQIVKLMLKMSSDEVDIRAMGSASRQIISRFTPQTWAQNLKNVIDDVLKNQDE
jgi:glycosyltransferase involved in cell wall biosynthesis